MGVIDRIVLTMYTLALATLSAFMMLVALFPTFMKPHVWIERTLSTGRGQLMIGVIGTAFFAVSVRLILFAFTRRGGGQPVIHENPLGEVRISLDAIESLVRKVARSVKGVREIKAVIAHGKDGLHAHLTGTVSAEASIPEISEEIQTSVRQYVKRVVGVEMTEIRFEVDNIGGDGRRRFD